jgi:hypothetical protein
MPGSPGDRAPSRRSAVPLYSVHPDPTPPQAARTASAGSTRQLGHRHRRDCGSFRRSQTGVAGNWASNHPVSARSRRERSAKGQLPRTRCRPATSATASAHTRFKSACIPPVGSRCCATCWIVQLWASAHAAGAPSEPARSRASSCHATRIRAASRALLSVGFASIRRRRLCWDRRAVREGIACPSLGRAGSGRNIASTTGTGPCGRSAVVLIC